MVKKRKEDIRVLLLGLFLILLGMQMFVGIKNNYEQDIQFVFYSNFEKEEVSEENKILEIRKEYSNDDITGYIVIDGTNISEPVLKYEDNDYYLHHDNYGNKEINGSIFQDYRISLNDKKILIYGHSSIYDVIPFNEIENYYDRDFYDKHKYIKLITEDSEYEYEIFSVYVETSDFSYMNLRISDDTYNEYLKKYKKRSLYDTGVNVVDNDEIIILQTCSNDNKYSRYKKKYLLVIGRKIFKEGKNER